MRSTILVINSICSDVTKTPALLSSRNIGDWANLLTNISAFIMWLYGAAGAGKSAIARTMAEILHDRQQLLGTFFFSSQDPSRNHIKSVVATLPYNISLSVPDSRPLIIATLDQDPLILNHTFAHQLERLIFEPLHPGRAHDREHLYRTGPVEQRLNFSSSS